MSVLWLHTGHSWQRLKLEDHLSFANQEFQQSVWAWWCMHVWKLRAQSKYITGYKVRSWLRKREGGREGEAGRESWLVQQIRDAMQIHSRFCPSVWVPSTDWLCLLVISTWQLLQLEAWATVEDRMWWSRAKKALLSRLRTKSFPSIPSLLSAQWLERLCGQC